MCSSSKRQLYARGLVVALAVSISGCANRAPQQKASSSAVSTSAPASPPVRPGGLRQDQSNIGSLNLFYGPGGKEHQPAGKFTFVKEDKEGTSPKFEVVDEQGVRWKAKLGEETKSETAATRLVWAAGYFTDEDYYLSELRVEKMPKLHRGGQFVSKGGVVHGVRLERKVKGQKKAGNWSWFKNPFEGTKELNGLKVMMALMNNWDLKEVNNAIYDEAGWRTSLCGQRPGCDLWPDRQSPGPVQGQSAGLSSNKVHSKGKIRTRGLLPEQPSVLPYRD